MDFDKGTISVNHQLQYMQKSKEWRLVSLKNDDKSRRTLTPAQAVMEELRHVKASQNEWRLALGRDYSNPWKLVFTHENGKYLPKNTIYTPFKKIATSIGLDAVRFHDLRHSFAMYALQNGESMKYLQLALGHTTYATTANVYGHVSQHMEKEAAARMNAFIQSERDKNA